MYLDDLHPQEILSPLTRELVESIAREEGAPLSVALARHRAIQEAGRLSPSRRARGDPPKFRPRARWDFLSDVERGQAGCEFRRSRGRR